MSAMTWLGATAAQGALASSAMQPSGTTLQFFKGDGSLATFISSAISAVTWSTLTGKPTFATVATSGSYTDLTSKPTLGTAAAQNTGAFDASGAASAAVSALCSGTTLQFLRGDGSLATFPTIGTQMSVDTGWTANTYGGVKTAVLVTYSLVISGAMVTALNLTSSGLGTSLVTMDQTLQLLVQQVAGLRTALIAAKLPNA